MYIYNEWSFLKIHRTYYETKIENTGRATQINISYIGDIGILNNNQSILIIPFPYITSHAENSVFTNDDKYSDIS